ncbi:MAG TPA: cbb3-type cytochrome c oxidase subunit I, partial [Balneolaceae bacterium]|nr:cbb3-type cytochrome c oxidase subunit I [Balneolaceae bacterium]
VYYQNSSKLSAARKNANNVKKTDKANMPVQSRWMLRLSLLYLLFGAILGAIMLIQKAFPFNAAVWVLRPVHIQLLIWGFIIQFTLGTAYYILPRYVKGSSRGSPALSWGIIIALNIGIFLNIIAAFYPGNSLRLTGLFFQALAVAFFVWLHWNRATSYNK